MGLLKCAFTKANSTYSNKNNGVRDIVCILEKVSKYSSVRDWAYCNLNYKQIILRSQDCS